MAVISRFWRITLYVTVAVLSAPTAAATIYGSLWENQLPVGNRSLQLMCSGRSAGTATTDPRGSYRFTVSETGLCTVKIGTLEAPVILSVNPTQYNFELRHDGGKPALIQR